MKAERHLLATAALVALTVILFAPAVAVAARPTLAAGFAHTVVLKSNGSLWAWGDNSRGQLGDGTTTLRKLPKRVGATRSWKGVSCGGAHTLAIAADGTLWAWGLNNYGQLGLGDLTKRTKPTRVSASTGWVSVYAGSQQSFAIRSDGSLWAWGYNGEGQLGVGDWADRRTPTQVSGYGWKCVGAAMGATVGIYTPAYIYGWGQWGYNWYPRYPLNNSSDWAAVSCGSGHALAIKDDGTLWTWGSDYTVLGRGSSVDSFTPGKVGTSTAWSMARGGEWHSAATRTDGTLWT